MRFDIPEDERALLEDFLFRSKSEEVDPVLDAFEGADPELRLSGLARRVSEAAGIDSERAERLTVAFLNLVQSVEAFDSGDRHDAIDTLFLSVVGELVEAEQRETFNERAERILELRSLRTTGKALSVKLGHASTYCYARAFSEIRPVFDDEDLNPVAALVMHQLKIVVHSGPSFEEHQTFVAMDKGGLKRLREVIDRALEKEQKLTELAERQGLAVLQYGHFDIEDGD